MNYQTIASVIRELCANNDKCALRCAQTTIEFITFSNETWIISCCWFFFFEDSFAWCTSIIVECWLSSFFFLFLFYFLLLLISFLRVFSINELALDTCWKLKRSHLFWVIQAHLSGRQWMLSAIEWIFERKSAIKNAIIMQFLRLSSSFLI